MTKFLIGFMGFALSFLFLTTVQATEAIRIVPNKDVCIVTNMHFGRTQIPVEQAGKTYYGCCDMCKGTLASDPSSRIAVDPVSKVTVDKSKAIIGALADGSVMYFESKNTFNKYKTQLNKLKKKPPS